MHARNHIIQGIPAMAEAIGLDARQLYYLKDKGQLYGLVKKGDRHYISLANLLSSFQRNGKLEIELREFLDRMSIEELKEILRYWECLP